MYQFVVAVLVPLQTLLARMCGVASENLVLLQILIDQAVALLLTCLQPVKLPCT